MKVKIKQIQKPKPKQLINCISKSDYNTLLRELTTEQALLLHEIEKLKTLMCLKSSERASAKPFQNAHLIFELSLRISNAEIKLNKNMQDIENLKSMFIIVDLR